MVFLSEIVCRLIGGTAEIVPYPPLQTILYKVPQAVTILFEHNFKNFNKFLTNKKILKRRLQKCRIYKEKPVTEMLKHIGF